MAGAFDGMKSINAIRMGGVDVLAACRGRQGDRRLNRRQLFGHWAAAGGAGTFSAVNADFYDEAGNPLDQPYHGPHPAGAA